MAITFVNKSAFASGTAGLTVGAVASVVADDLILLFAESANENIATPSGYTQVTGSPVSTGTAASAGGVRLAVFYQWATGADTTTSVADSGNHTTAIKIAYRGVDKTTPFDATPVTGIKTPASTSSSFPGITTTTANALIVHASGLDLDAASTATTGAATNANLTGITERHDQTISGGVGGGLVIIEGTKATAGATGNTTATVTSTIQVYLTMALREFVDLTVTITGNSSRTDHTATTGGVTQTHLTAGNSAAQATTGTSGAVTSEHTLLGNSAAQPTTSTTGAVQQITDVNLTGNSARQDTLSTAGAVSQIHLTAGSSARQDTATTTGAVGQTHVALGNSVRSDTTATTGAVSQTHVLAGNASRTDHTATTGAIDLTFTHSVTGNSVRVDHTALAGQIVQTHLLAGASAAQGATATTGAVASEGQLQAANVAQPTTSTAGAVSQTHLLAGAATQQPNTSTNGEFGVPGAVTLMAAPVAVDHIAAASAIAQTHVLGGDYVAPGYVQSGYVLYGSVVQPTASTSDRIRMFSGASSDRRVDIPVTAMPAYVEPGVFMAAVPASAQTARIDPIVLVAQVAAPSLSSSVAAQAQRVTVPV